MYIFVCGCTRIQMIYRVRTLSDRHTSARGAGPTRALRLSTLPTPGQLEHTEQGPTARSGPLPSQQAPHNYTTGAANTAAREAARGGAVAARAAVTAAASSSGAVGAGGGSGEASSAPSASTGSSAQGPSAAAAHARSEAAPSSPWPACAAPARPRGLGRHRIVPAAGADGYEGSGSDA